MTITDQGAVLRRAVKERLEQATADDIVFDIGGPGMVPSEHGRPVLGYMLIFKATPPAPLLGETVSPLVHTTVLEGHTPTDAAVGEVVDTALSVLREKAARQLAGPPPGWIPGRKYPA